MGIAGPAGSAADTTTGATTTDSTTTATTPTPSPKNATPPAISGTLTGGQTLTADPGTWTGVPPFTFTYEWQRCDASGGTCADIAGATSQTYAAATADVGHALRVVVTAKDAAGGAPGSATSNATAAVSAAGPSGAIKLPNGKTSIPVTSVVLPNRLVVDGVRFSPSRVTSRQQPIAVRVHVSDTHGNVVRGALVFVRSTPLVTTPPPEQVTGQGGYVTLSVFPRAIFPVRHGFSIQFFVRTRKEGEPVLAGVSSRRLAQVATG